MKICPRLIIFELSDCTLRIFRGYDFRIFKILLFLDRYFGVFDSDLRASPPPHMFSYGVPPGGNNTETKGHLFSRGGAHKHFFDRNTRSRTNFNYPKKIE